MHGKGLLSNLINDHMLISKLPILLSFPPIKKKRKKKIKHETVKAINEKPLKKCLEMWNFIYRSVSKCITNSSPWMFSITFLLSFEEKLFESSWFVYLFFFFFGIIKSSCCPVELVLN